MSHSLESLTGDSLRERVELQCRSKPGGIALLAPGFRPLSYGQLAEQIDYIGTTIRSLGVQRSGPSCCGTAEWPRYGCGIPGGCRVRHVRAFEPAPGTRGARVLFERPPGASGHCPRRNRIARERCCATSRSDRYGAAPLPCSGSRAFSLQISGKASKQPRQRPAGRRCLGAAHIGNDIASPNWCRCRIEISVLPPRVFATRSSSSPKTAV